MAKAASVGYYSGSKMLIVLEQRESGRKDIIYECCLTQQMFIEKQK